MPLLRALVLTLMTVAMAAASHAARAEFYRWTDARGQIRISNIPPRGVTTDGSVLPRFNPASIAAQQAALRARLKARDEALRAAQDAQSAARDAAPVTPDVEDTRSK